MGRDLGYFASEELDRPELNKCPDCECYFATDECPLCGKICPEEMRAGNRASPKKPKKQKNSSGRVQFIPWYHTWGFIALMMVVQPIIGLILFFTSPHSKKSKIIVASVAVGGFVLCAFLVTFGKVFLWNFFYESPVNDEIPRAEYIERCDSMSVEDYHRDAYNEGNYVTLELKIEDYITNHRGETYYVCTALNGGDVKILLYDCSVEKKTNYMRGDMIRVYGECSGTTGTEIGEEEFPLLYMAYSELIG